MASPSSVRGQSAIAKSQLQLRDQLWPDSADLLWHRTVHRGYTTIPRTMPLVLKIMDAMSKKGLPLSSTYLALWCATWDNSFVVLRPRELAFAAGFGGQRAERTWATRMRLLQELQFIDIKPGKGGEFGYALIYNPHLVIRSHRHDKTPGLGDADYAALIEVASEIGAKDMTEEKAAA